MRARFGFKGIRRDICRTGRGARTGAHLGERPGVGVLALYGFGKNTGLWHSLSIEIEADMGVVEAKFGQAHPVRPGERTFRDEPSPF